MSLTINFFISLGRRCPKWKVVRQKEFLTQVGRLHRQIEPSAFSVSVRVLLRMGEAPRPGTERKPLDLVRLSIHDMTAATKINSFESDRCLMIAMENGTWHGERKKKRRGISSSRELDFQKIQAGERLLCMQSAASNSQISQQSVHLLGGCRERLRGAQAEIQFISHIRVVTRACRTHQRAGLPLSFSPLSFQSY